MIRRPPRSTPKPSSAASDVYKRQVYASAVHMAKAPDHQPDKLTENAIAPKVAAQELMVVPEQRWPHFGEHRAAYHLSSMPWRCPGCIITVKDLYRGKEAFWKHRAGKLTQWRIIELTGCPRLDTSKVHQQELPPDIEDFVNAPSTVQCLAPETWDIDVWIQLAINEPEYIAVAPTANGPRAVCKQCGKKMSCQHLLFEGCWRHLCEKKKDEDNDGNISFMQALSHMLVNYPPTVHEVIEQD